MRNDAPSAAGKPGLVYGRRLAKGHLPTAIRSGPKSRACAGRGGGGRIRAVLVPTGVLSAFFAGVRS